MLVLLALATIAWDTPPATTNLLPDVAIVGAADTLMNGDSTRVATATFPLRAGAMFYSIASDGGGTGGTSSRVHIRMWDRTGSVADSTVLIIPVGGGDTDWVPAAGLFFVEVREVAAGDSLIIKVR